MDSRRKRIIAIAVALAGAALVVGGVWASGRGELPTDPKQERAEGAQCLDAAGRDAVDTSQWADGETRAQVEVSGTRCFRRYSLTSNAELRDGQPENPRTFQESSGWPVVRTRNAMFDALYALALEEVRENSVEQIQDDAFADGKPLQCPEGGCFETGRKWRYVWTRDTAYAVDLGLGALDPTRARNSLEFKLSERRSGDDLQIVQDTGSGGSYPVSTDRVVWALGAMEVLEYLQGEERQRFAARAYEALRNTVEHDRAVVFDERDGLYTGETSFLDWREQTYPSWTAEDTVHVGMSKALSTNVGHLAAIEAAAALAAEHGDGGVQRRYELWATKLRERIHARFYLEDAALHSSFVTTSLDPAPARRYDLLGQALAVLYGIGDEQQRRAAVESYPHLRAGAPVIWPQQPEVPIYHNRAIWPFVTAYWLRAAKEVQNDEAVEHAVRSLVRGAALNLSNMENLEMVSGAPYKEQEELSGPVVNSQRQLWSVAAYVSMVHDVVFGLDASREGIRFVPYITRGMRHELFGNADTLVLREFPYRERRIDVVVKLPAREDQPEGGAYAVERVRLDGEDVGTDHLAPSALSDHSLIEIELGEGHSRRTITRVDEPADHTSLFGPRPPQLESPEWGGGKLGLRWTYEPMADAEVGFRIYRDGDLVASDLDGTARQWWDGPVGPDASSRCYTIEAYFTASGNTSQRARPSCWWGAPQQRRHLFEAETLRHDESSGPPDEHAPAEGEGRTLSEGERLVVPRFEAKDSGPHWIALRAANGTGPINTGVTCAVMRVDVEPLDGGEPIASGYLFVPHTGQDNWTRWRRSSLMQASLERGKAYRVVVHHDERAVNMSHFSHFERYTGGRGGSEGSVNRARVAAIEIMWGRSE